MPLVATRPLNPLSRARSRRMLAKLMSSSTIRTARSPSWISLRSSRIAAASLESSARASLSKVSTGVQAASISLHADTGSSAGWLRLRGSGRCVVARQIESKGAAFARRADDANLASKQTGDLATDRKSQTGAAVFAAGGAVCLLKGFEDDPLLLRGNADARVAYGECHDVTGPAQRLEMIGFVLRRRSDGSARPDPRSVNLNALESRFISICCSRLSSVRMAAGSFSSRSIRNSRFLS